MNPRKQAAGEQITVYRTDTAGFFLVLLLFFNCTCLMLPYGVIKKNIIITRDCREAVSDCLRFNQRNFLQKDPISLESFLKGLLLKLAHCV